MRRADAVFADDFMRRGGVLSAELSGYANGWRQRRRALRAAVVQLSSGSLTSPCTRRAKKHARDGRRQMRRGGEAVINDRLPFVLWVIGRGLFWSRRGGRVWRIRTSSCGRGIVAGRGWGRTGPRTASWRR